MAEAKLLKEASTAPIAMASAWSLQYGVERRRSSNTCRWNMAASASRAIWHMCEIEDARSEGVSTPTTSTCYDGEESVGKMKTDKCVRDKEGDKLEMRQKEQSEQ